MAGGRGEGRHGRSCRAGVSTKDTSSELTFGLSNRMLAVPWDGVQVGGRGGGVRGDKAEVAGLECQQRHKN